MPVTESFTTLRCPPLPGNLIKSGGSHMSGWAPWGAMVCRAYPERRGLASSSGTDGHPNPGSPAGRPVSPAASHGLPGVDPDQAGLWVAHAGLVLLYPFLQPFFAGLGLMEQGQFSDTTAAYMGVSLLYFLATGNGNPCDSELVVPKLLCGLPVYEPAGGYVQPGEDARREGYVLLESVIGHWPALKSASPEQLRQVFLQRKGMLRAVAGEGCRLYPEQHPLDILLHQLPWSISIVKLPWMDQLLFITWS